MSYYNVIFPCVLFLANFLLKSSPRLIKNFLPKGDTFTHLYITRLIHRTKKIPKTLPHWLIDDCYRAPFAYPFLMHLALALLPTQWLEKHEKFIGPFISSCDILIIYLFSTIWLSSYWAALLTFFYIITPINFPADISFTTRPFGKFLINIAILSAIILCLNQEIKILFLVLSVISGVAIFLSHKFSSQVWLFSILLILVATNFNLKIFSIIAGVFFMLLIPFRKIYFKTILTDHINTLRWHYENTKNKVKVFYTSYRITIKTLIGEYIYNPFFPLFIIFFIQDINFFLGNPLYKLLLFWAFGLQLVVYLVKYPKKLRFLGEGARYKYYNIFPIVFLVTVYISYHWTIANIILLFVSIIVSIASCGYIIKNRILSSVDLSADKQLKVICQKLKKLSGDNVWEMGCIPPAIVMYLSNKKVLACLHSGTCLKEPNLFPEKRISHFHSYVIYKYKINYLLIDKTCRARDYSQMYEELNEIGSYKKVAEEGRYYILKIIPNNSK